MADTELETIIADMIWCLEMAWPVVHKAGHPRLAERMEQVIERGNARK